MEKPASMIEWLHPVAQFSQPATRMNVIIGYCNNSSTHQTRMRGMPQWPKREETEFFLPTQYYFHLAFLQNIELVQKEKKVCLLGY